MGAHGVPIVSHFQVVCPLLQVCPVSPCPYTSGEPTEQVLDLMQLHYLCTFITYILCMYVVIFIFNVTLLKHAHMYVYDIYCTLFQCCAICMFVLYGRLFYYINLTYIGLVMSQVRGYTQLLIR